MVARLKLLPGSIFFPSFMDTVLQFYRLIADGILVESFWRSLVRVLAGFFAGSLGGFLVGLLMGWKDLANRAFSPIISLIYPIPALGWLPLLMLWIGISEMLPITMVFIGCFFPLCYNTAGGVRSVDARFVRAARTLGATEFEILYSVVLPLAAPQIFTGFRLQAGMAWRMIIAAEMVAIPTGIGALLMRAESLIRIDMIIVCLMVLSIMCFLFDRFFLYAERALTQWR
jgi:NitT/TauT family transport system permease protein